MKALDLVIYPPVPPDPYESGQFLHNEPEVLDWENARFNEDVSRYQKRLAEPELAAEYWRSREDTAYIVEGITWESMADEWSISEADALDRTHILRRFATLPHYDEDQP